MLDGRDRDIRRRYDHPHRHELAGDSSYEAAQYFDNLGDDGRYLLFSAAPVTDEDGKLVGAVELFEDVTEHRRQVHNFDVMERIAHVQWDTLLFFYGVILCVAGLGEFGYLTWSREPFTPTLALPSPTRWLVCYRPSSTTCR